MLHVSISSGVKLRLILNMYVIVHIYAVQSSKSSFLATDCSTWSKHNKTLHPWLRLLLPFICFNLLVPLRFLYSRRARTTRVATTHLSTVNSLYLYVSRWCTRMLTCMLKTHTDNNINKYLPSNLFLCVRQAIESSSSPYELFRSFSKCRAPQVIG